MSYRVLIEKSAQKSLKKIPEPEKNKIIDSIVKLSETPRPVGAKKLTGRKA